MEEQSLITREMREAIDIESEPFVIQIDRWLVKLFLEAVDDRNPLYSNDEFASSTRFARTIVPPSLFAAALMRGSQLQPNFNIPLRHILDGGSDFEFFKTVRIGDVLTARTRLVDIRERQGKVGRMLFLTYETRWINQKSELVTVCRGVRVCY